MGIWRDGVHLGRVDSRDRLRHHRRASIGQHANDVALTGDSVDRGAVLRDDDGADLVLSEHAEQLPYVTVGSDRDDLSAFDAKYIADAHLALSDTVVGKIIPLPELQPKASWTTKPPRFAAAVKRRVCWEDERFLTPFVPHFSARMGRARG